MSSNPYKTPEPWIDTAAACKHLGISGTTMLRWIKAKKPGLKVRRLPSGEYRFRHSELDSLLEYPDELGR